MLVSASSDGSISFWDARAGQLLLHVADACERIDGLLHVCAEETNTFLITGDSGGHLKVWDISALIDQSVRSESIDRASIKLLFSWRAHLSAIVRVEHLKGIEGIVSASSDCTVRLWSLSGEQIGIFGQASVWQLGDHMSYLDAECAKISCRGGESSDKTTYLDKLVPVGKNGGVEGWGGWGWMGVVGGGGGGCAVSLVGLDGYGHGYGYRGEAFILVCPHFNFGKLTLGLHSDSWSLAFIHVSQGATPWTHSSVSRSLSRHRTGTQ